MQYFVIVANNFLLTEHYGPLQFLRDIVINEKLIWWKFYYIEFLSPNSKGRLDGKIMNKYESSPAITGVLYDYIFMLLACFWGQWIFLAIIV